jgi:hypothetical protein
LIHLLVLLVVIGVALYFVGQLPIDPKFMVLVRAVAVIFAVLLILSYLFPGYMPATMRHWE